VRRTRTLYLSHVGNSFVGWWDTEPPQLLSNGRCPRFRAPDIYHDHTVGNTEAVLGDLCVAGIVPDRKLYRLSLLPQEWVAAGLRSAAANRVKHRQPPPNPENGLFEKQYVQPVSRDGVPG
jgi:hypothetical protein